MSQEVGVVLLVVAGLMQVAAIAVSSWILSGDHPQTDSPQTPSMEASLATGRAWLRGEGAPIWKGMVVLIVVAALAWAAISLEESIGDPMLAVWLGWLAGLLVFGLALGLIVLALLPKKNARHSNAIDEDDRSSPNEDHPEGTLRSDQRV
jgi:hypothetical protein